MSDRAAGSNEVSLPSILAEVPPTEATLHREFLHRHIDFLIDTLTGEQFHRYWSHPVACPTATPESLARRRRSGEHFPCRYTEIEAEQDSPGCCCGDPLAGSTDPLDTVAAVAITLGDRSPAERYFDYEERQIIANLRDTVGTWAEIAALDTTELTTALEAATNRDGVSQARVTQLNELLKKVDNLSETDGVTLDDIPPRPYASLKDLLADLPGISESDAWWLLLVAFDKPVWPSDPHIDALLCSLGLLSPDTFNNTVQRRTNLEEQLVDRQIPQLHRALAGHALKGDIDVCDTECEVRKFMLTHRLRCQRDQEDRPVLVDLFCGAGGLSLGFTEAGWRVELAIDNDQDATDTYRLNHPEIPHKNVLCSDIREVLEDGITEHLTEEPDVVVGGPPCQSLSIAGYRSRRADDEEYSILEDDRTQLYQEYVSVIETLQPKAFVLENVEGMANEIGDSGVKVIDLVEDSLESITAGDHEYVCDHEVLGAAEYGIPQRRERVFVIGVREDTLTSTSVPDIFDNLSKHGVNGSFNLQDGLSGLPKLRRGEGGRVVARRPPGKHSAYVTENGLADRAALCFNHQAREHPMKKDRMLFDEALEPGDTAWDLKYAKDSEYAHLIEYDVGTEDNPRFKDKYRMLRWDEPAPTVVAHLAKDANNFVLPDYYEYASPDSSRTDPARNRGVTPREAARLQGFPDEYILLGTFTSWFRQVGNAVPPLLGKRIGNALSDVLLDNKPVLAQLNTGVVESLQADD